MGTAANKSGSGTLAISLPKGGGAFRSIGEKFAVNRMIGISAMSVSSAGPWRLGLVTLAEG